MRRRALRQAGAALLTALWLLTLLLLLATSTVALVAAETRSARRAAEAVQAKLLREGAVNRAIQRLADSQTARRPAIANGTTDLSLFDATFTLDVSDERGRIDLNAASDDLLALLFARALVAQIRDWRDKRPFESVAELRQVPGLSPEVLGCTAKAVTVYSGGDLDVAQASPMVRKLLGAEVKATSDESSLAGRVLRIAIRRRNEATYDSVVLRVTGDDHLPALVMHWSTEFDDSRGERCAGVLAIGP